MTERDYDPEALHGATPIAQVGATGAESGVEPHEPLRIMAHEQYAISRSRGIGIARAAKLAGVSESTARKIWEPPNGDAADLGIKYTETGVGGAIQRRISWLRQTSAATISPSVGTITFMQMQLAQQCMESGNLETARRILAELKAEAKQHADELGEGDLGEPIDAKGEDVTDLLSRPDDPE